MCVPISRLVQCIMESREDIERAGGCVQGGGQGGCRVVKGGGEAKEGGQCIMESREDMERAGGRVQGWVLCLCMPVRVSVHACARAHARVCGANGEGGRREGGPGGEGGASWKESREAVEWASGSRQGRSKACSYAVRQAGK